MDDNGGPEGSLVNNAHPDLTALLSRQDAKTHAFLHIFASLRLCENQDGPSYFNPHRLGQHVSPVSVGSKMLPCRRAGRIHGLFTR